MPGWAVAIITGVVIGLLAGATTIRYEGATVASVAVAAASNIVVFVPVSLIGWGFLRRSLR